MKRNTKPYFNPEKAFRARSPFLICGLLAFGSLALLPRCADAQTALVTSGNWDVVGNWSNGVPASSTPTTVDNNLTVSVPVGVSGSATYLNVGVYGTGVLNINGGTVTNSYGIIGHSADSHGTATVSSGIWANSGYLYVGSSGTGVLNINGGTVRSNDSLIGAYDTSNGTATITSGTWANSGRLYVGFRGTGALNIDGGTVTNSEGYIGVDTTTNGTATVTSGIWANSYNFYVGHSGTGALSIDGGTVTNNLGYIGYLNGSNGTATVTSGTWANSGSLSVGYYGTGALNINGGIVTNSSSAIGLNLNSNGTATVTSGIWANSDSLVVGHSGTGVLNINGGTVINSMGIIGHGASSNGTATVSSGNWVNSSDVYVGLFGTGALNINGGTVTNTLGYIGYFNGSNGTATITSGTWANSGSLTVGSFGTGTLNINGGTVTNLAVLIGEHPNSNGTVTVTSGTWISSMGGGLVVGVRGMGALDINGGTVIYSDAYIGYFNGSNGTVTVTSGTWVNSQGLQVGYYGTGALNLSGNGVVSIADGTGTLLLASGTGSVGTLNLGTGAEAGALEAAVVTGGSGTATVNFNQTGNYTFAPQLTGNLSVNKLGNGTTILTGSSNYTGVTTVQSGALLVNGSIVSDVTVAGGLLGGSGFIGGNVVNQGRVSPGNSPGILTIGGDYTQTSTGSLLIQIASGTSYDKLIVGGHANLDGTLEVSLLNGFTLKKGDKFAFITAGAGVSGSFSNISVDSVMELKVTYDPLNAALGLPDDPVLVVQQGLFANVPGLTPNERAVAKGLDKVVDDPRVANLVGYLDGLRKGAIPQKLEEIVPTDLIPMFDASIASAQVQAFNLERRMEEIRGGATGFSAAGLRLSDSHGTRSCNGNADGKQAIGKDGKTLEPAPISDRWGFFINGSGEFVDEESTAIARGTDFTTGGITTGADYRLGNHAAVGLTAGYANTSSNGRADDAVKIDSGKLGLYGTVFDRGFFLNGVVGGGLNSYDTKRDMLGGQARGDAEGTDFNALLGTGYTYRKGGLSVGPIASVRYSWVGIESFTERGSLAPLQISEQSESSLKTTAGWQTSYAFMLGKVAVTPQVRAQWQHEYFDTARGIGASFLPGGAFTVYGPEIGRDSLLLDIGTTVQLTQNVGVYAFYTGNLGGKDYTSHAVNGGVQINF